MCVSSARAKKLPRSPEKRIILVRDVLASPRDDLINAKFNEKMLVFLFDCLKSINYYSTKAHRIDLNDNFPSF